MMIAEHVAGGLIISTGVGLVVMGLVSLFRTLVLDFNGVLAKGEGAAFIRIGAVTLGVATAALLLGVALLQG